VSTEERELCVLFSAAFLASFYDPKHTISAEIHKASHASRASKQIGRKRRRAKEGMRVCVIGLVHALFVLIAYYVISREWRGAADASDLVLEIIGEDTVQSQFMGLIVRRPSGCLPERVLFGRL
jgi:hypothetical protein